ncbi:hypothetical protein Scep_001726 [Stephania cephalantha]|uniref:Uncharacterized protein n=1 Tax=Stephania cephalantha TaxID=152367 RepID=A0AAP0L9L9_9MAGN
MANPDNDASSSSVSSARTTTTSTVPTLTPFGNLLSQIVSIKLDESNFLL